VTIAVERIAYLRG